MSSSFMVFSFSGIIAFVLCAIHRSVTWKTKIALLRPENSTFVTSVTAHLLPGYVGCPIVAAVRCWSSRKAQMLLKKTANAGAPSTIMSHLSSLHTKNPLPSTGFPPRGGQVPLALALLPMV
jgi:hypothetical protein